MVRIRIKVSSKGQIVIPKMLREAYKIKENSYVIIEPRDDGLLIKSIEDPDEVINWIKARKQRIEGIKGKLGDLAHIDLEEEFED